MSPLPQSDQASQTRRLLSASRWLLLSLLLVGGLTGLPAAAQRAARPSTYVDQQGVLRWRKDKREVALFGVNYTAPFAYSYRAHRRLGVPLERAIEQDVYHLARLGVTAFRVHVWDVEISDTLGNLLANEHLRLLDFLVARLEERGIKLILTPIAYWGNGYPEPDTAQTGFSAIYDKTAAYTNPRAVRAQENYLAQFLRHRNAYTGRRNQDDDDIVAFEVCNEPRYQLPLAPVTAFANRMVAAIRGTGCRKPIFYNIAENPAVHEAILDAHVDGLTYQWYPQGLVGGHALRGNFLPYVDQYPIPYRQDPRFRRRAKMAYEFESADMLQPVMYPFMARSFRAAGFQWATQFAYDPLALAYANTEYQTHYLNLAYTPAKALSLLIAGEVFRRVKRGQAFGPYPADSAFGDFRVSYRQQLSELNAPEAFYYTSSTATQPRNLAALRRVAGTGTSAVAAYGGTGAYFLDRLAPGVWRLEVLPDAVPLRDPFATTSLRQVVTQIGWNDQPLRLALPDLGAAYSVQGLNAGNDFRAQAQNGAFMVRPGAYLLAAPGRATAAFTAQTQVGNFRLGEFVAPPPTPGLGPQVVHTAPAQVGAGRPLPLVVRVTGAATPDSLLLVVQSYYGRTTTLPMRRPMLTTATATVPAELLRPGLLRYWVVLRQAGQARTFPGGFAGTPRDWDYAHAGHWETLVVSPAAPLPLFTARPDHAAVEIARLARSSYADYVTTPAGALAVRLLVPAPRASEPANEAGPAIALRAYFGDKLTGRQADLGNFREVVVRARAARSGAAVRLLLTTHDAAAYAAPVPLTTELREIHIPLVDFRPAPLLLVPRSYPSFLPLTFQTTVAVGPLVLSAVEALQFVVDAGPDGTAPDVELEAIWVQ